MKTDTTGPPSTVNENIVAVSESARTWPTPSILVELEQAEPQLLAGVVDPLDRLSRCLQRLDRSIELLQHCAKW